MNWVYGGLILMGVGLALRRVLGLGKRHNPRLAGLAHLSPELHAIYHPVAQEVETHAAILSISLNDAFEERAALHYDIAWHLVRLSAGEWDRLAGTLMALLNILAKHTTNGHLAVPARRIVPDHFKSRVMTDYLNIHELLDKLVFHSHQRFQLQIRLLRRAIETLTKEFRCTCLYLERLQDRSQEVWIRLDLYFHDFDLIAKETLLAFRALLACLPAAALPDLTAELRAVLEPGVRTLPVQAGR
jgi:hypothetical protein